MIWDGSPIHRSQTIKAFLAGGAAHRLHLERLPAYAPELNPDEGIWQYLKHVELRNLCCPTLWDSTRRSPWRLVGSGANRTLSAAASLRLAADSSSRRHQ